MTALLGAVLSAMLGMASVAVAEQAYLNWQREGLGIPRPLGELRGDPERGRALVIDRHKGNCLACHVLPIPEETFHGTLGPPLLGVGARLSEAELRLRVVDEKQINPLSVMPGYYRAPRHFRQVLAAYEGKTLLSAQEVEDVVAYLVTLR